MVLHIFVYSIHTSTHVTCHAEAVSPISAGYFVQVYATSLACLAWVFVGSDHFQYASGLLSHMRRQYPESWDKYLQLVSQSALCRPGFMF